MSDGVLSTEYELTSLAIRNYNRTMMELGTKIIDEIPLENREVSTLQYSVSEKGLKK